MNADERGLKRTDSFPVNPCVSAFIRGKDAFFGALPGFAIGSIVAAGLLLVLAACANRPPRASSIGEAYVGAAELKIRSDIPLESSTVATVRHGDRLEILQQRRNVFLRVRTPNGAEGWTDARQLLAAREIASLRDLAERARRMPSQGVATTYGDLRVRTQPSASAPSFLLIKENEKFDVLASLIVPRASVQRPSLVAPPAPKQPKVQPQKTSKASKLPLPPMPKPPGPPADWLELSRTEPSGDAESLPADNAGQKPTPADNWSLVRTSGGQSGWVLTRRLWMAIPDEVARYAEGHRIVSYFSLGEVRDGDQTMHEWLWTTSQGGAQAYDFDSFRVFVWSLRRHRYETAYIERNLKGHSPVLLKEVELSTGSRKGRTAAAKYPGFSICVEKADGQRRWREFAFLTPSVRFAGEQACEAAEPLLVQVSPLAPTSTAPPAASASRKSESLAQRVKRKWGAITQRWFGR
jgi:hypothetical protein